MLAEGSSGWLHERCRCKQQQCDNIAQTLFSDRHGVLEGLSSKPGLAKHLFSDLKGLVNLGVVQSDMAMCNERGK